MLTLLLITAANVVSRLAAALLAYWLSFRIFVRWARVISALAAGLMLSLACTHLVPEAVHAGVDMHEGGLVLLLSFVFFISLEWILIRFAGHSHGATSIRTRAVLLGGKGIPESSNRVSAKGVTLLLGAACHSFVDGVMIAAAFMVSNLTGVVVTAAVFGHELPQMVGQLVILVQTGLSKGRALCLLLMSASASVLGGAAGWEVFDGVQGLVGYAMLVSAASFLYVVLGVLLPEMTHGSCNHDLCGIKQPIRELTALAAGIVISLLILTPLHEQAHEVVHEAEHSQLEQVSDR